MIPEGLQRKRCVAMRPGHICDASPVANIVEEKNLPSRRKDGLAEAMLVANRWSLQCHLGTGSQGAVWKALDVRTGDPVAIKICLSSENENATLEHEASALQLLRNNSLRLGQPEERPYRNPSRAQGPNGRIPSLIFYGPSGPYLQQRDAALSQRHEILVQTYFETVSLAGFIPGDEGLCSNGPSPTDKRMRSLWPREHAAMTPGGRLAVAVCCGQQILKALKYVHAAGLIHGDVSMANILIGGLKQEDLAALSVEGIADIPWRKEERSAVYRRCLDHMESYLVDFGVCTNWADAYGAHEPLNQSTAQENCFNGTMQFASLNVMRGLRPCRRDDIVSLIYCLIRFLKGRLPWSDCSVCQVTRLKAETSITEVASGCPTPLQAALAHASGLKFDEQPNYELIHHLLGCCISEDSAAMAIVPAATDDSESLFPACGRTAAMLLVTSTDAAAASLPRHRIRCSDPGLGFGSGQLEKPPSPPPKRGRTNKTLGPRPPAMRDPTDLGLDDSDGERPGGLSAAVSPAPRAAERVPSAGIAAVTAALANRTFPESPSFRGRVQAGALLLGQGAPQDPPPIAALEIPEDSRAVAGSPDADTDAEECGHVGAAAPRTGRRRLVPGRWGEGALGESDSDDSMEDAGGGDGMGGKRRWRGAAAAGGGGGAAGL